MPSFNVSVLILAGGRSTRLGGKDKALLQIERTSLLQRVLDVALSLSDDVLVLVDVPAKYVVDEGVRQVVDTVSGKGPLGGLYTGLLQMRHDRCLLLACDSPFPNGGLLQWLLEQLDGFDAVVPRMLLRQGSLERPHPASSHRYFPLHAAYHRRCLPVVKRLLDQGQLAMRCLLDRLNVHYVEGEALTQMDPRLMAFINVNTLSDLEFAKQKAISNTACF